MNNKTIDWKRDVVNGEYRSQAFDTPSRQCRTRRDQKLDHEISQKNTKRFTDLFVAYLSLLVEHGPLPEVFGSDENGDMRLCLKVFIPKYRDYVRQTSDGRFLKRVGSHRHSIPPEQLGRLLEHLLTEPERINPLK